MWMKTSLVKKGKERRYFPPEKTSHVLTLKDNPWCRKGSSYSCIRTYTGKEEEEEDFCRMEWPAKSPDLNPIDHAKNALGRATAQR
ncbi:hypothetical protein TNCV_3070491 [Trichonephila clavipes]|nr:hypothetical protein TNCV_3070491 [Trichonephila clavipes]